MGGNLGTGGTAGTGAVVGTGGIASTGTPDAAVVWVAAPVVSSPGDCEILTTTDSATLQFTVWSLANIDQFTFNIREASGCGVEPTGLSVTDYPKHSSVATPKTYTLVSLSPGKWYKYSVETTATAAGYHSNNVERWFKTATAVSDAGPDMASGGTGGNGGTGGTVGAAGATGSATPPSCLGLAATCGPSGNEYCCTSLLVPGGTFYRNYDGVSFTDMRFPATVSDFFLDKYEITVGRFRQFVNSGKGTQANPPSSGDGAHPLITGSGWDTAWNANLPSNTQALLAAMPYSSTLQTWTETIGESESRPINYIGWYLASAFCSWDGGRLPTDAEWNYAAAGGSEQRVYPWSSPPTSMTIDPSYASYYVDNACMGDGVADCKVSDNIVVGSKPVGNGKWGQSDLSGNVAEWTFDWYLFDYIMPCIDCARIADAGFGRVLRGGHLGLSSLEIRAVHREGLNPLYRSGRYSSDIIGARCARSAP
jgi:formylglycine-generating enzyme required for sulfatase activity